jgi:protocatechuate 3,4-dioxygenase beta subunit
MRPLHSLLVLVALLLVAAGGWLLLRSTDPARRITAAGPAASAAPAPAAGPAGDLRAPDEVAAERRVESAATPVAGPALAADRGAAAPAESALTGRVLDPQGAPVAGARVLLGEGSAGFLRGTALDAKGASRFFELQETATDAQGRFRFEGLEASALRLAVRASGFAPYDAVDIPRPSSAVLADIVLESGVRLAGRVVDADGRPAAGVEVLRGVAESSGPFRFGGQSAPATVTAADGSFVVDVLAAGPWTLEFESERHPDARLSGSTERAGQRVDDLLVQLERGASIRGRVTGSLPEGRDYSRLRISAVPTRADDLPAAEARSSKVAADGSFAVDGARAGRRYAVRAVELQGTLDDMPFDFLPGVAAAVEAEAGDQGVVLVLSPEAALRFSVVDAATGAALEEFQVEAGVDWPQPLLDDEGRVRRQHPGGLVRVGDLRPRSSGERATLRIEAVGYEPYEASGLKLAAGVDTELGTIALRPAPVLTVRVLDAVSGAPVANADVRLSTWEPPQVEAGAGMRRTIRASAAFGGDVETRMGEGDERRARTDDEGRARLTAFSGVDVRLNVRASGYALSIGEVFRASGEAEERAMFLTRGGSVVVRLFDAAGEPLAGGRVEHKAFHDEEGLPEFRSPALTDEGGRARFEHLAPGRHRFRRAGSGSGGVFTSGGNTFAVMVAGDDVGGDDWVEAQVVEGGEHEVAIHLPLELAVHGRLTEAGTPLAGATLSLVEAPAVASGMPAPAMFGGDGPQATADAAGRWRFEGIEPGEYTLRIRHESRAMPSEVALEVVDREVQRDVDLDVAILEGRVLDAAGKPLAGVEVWSERARELGAPRAMRIMAFASVGGGMTTLDSGGGSTARARSDADGRYVLRGVLSGVELEVRARGDGLQPGRSERLRLEPDEHRRGLDVTLETAGSINVEGRYADGSPAAELLITARYEGDRSGVEPQTILLDAAGRGRIDGLAPGPWRVTARSIRPGGSEQAPSELSVDVAAGEATPAAITMP